MKKLINRNLKINMEVLKKCLHDMVSEFPDGCRNVDVESYKYAKCKLDSAFYGFEKEMEKAETIIK